MVDDNSTTERVEASEGGQLQNDLVLRLECKILHLEEEVAHMRDLTKLSISLGTQFGENIDNPPNQTATPDNPPIHISPPEPFVQMPFHHPTPKIPNFHFTTITNIPNQPSQKQPQTQISHILLETTTLIQYTWKLPL